MQAAKNKKQDEFDKINNDTPDFKDSFLAQITNRNMTHQARLGLFAAAMGYDAILTGKGTGYTVILNRSKLIMSNEVDYV